MALAGKTVGASSPVLVFIDGIAPAEAPAIGAGIAVQGTLRRTEAGSSTAWLLFARGRPDVLAPPPWYLSWADALRGPFREAATALPGDGSQLVPGLALGDEALVSPSLDDAMKRSGLSHLTAVSGANCAVVIACVMLLGARLGVRRSIRLTAAATVLLLFVVLVTPQPSVLRAAAMAAIVLASIGVSRAARGMPVLCLAVILLILFDPWMSRSHGFALSVLATGGLLLLTGPLARALARWLPAWAATAVAVPVAAQLACQPVLVLLAPVLTPYAVLANVLAAPAAPVATVVGLVVCLLGAMAPPLAAAGAWLCWPAAAWIAAVARFFAQLPGASLPWLPGPTGALALAALTVLGLWSLMGRPRLRLRPARRIVGLALVIGVVGVYGGTLIGSTLGQRLAMPGDWQIAACDIGQGDAVIVRSDDSYALVDTGPAPARLEHCLAQLGIGRLDLVVLTHYDLDHVGGVPAVLGRADAVLVGPTDGPQDEAMLRRLRAGGAEVRQARRGDGGTLGSLAWRVLWPTRDTTLVGNPGSVTVEFSGGYRALFLGDLDEDSQNALLRASPLPHEDIVKVAHHGSGDQSPGLYEKIRADLGIISVGAGNHYGHPNPRALEILFASGTRVLRTDESGLMVVGITEHGYEVWSERRATVAVGSSG